MLRAKVSHDPRAGKRVSTPVQQMRLDDLPRNPKNEVRAALHDVTGPCDSQRQNTHESRGGPGSLPRHTPMLVTLQPMDLAALIARLQFSMI
jgi:hypothetical protein